MNVIDYIFRKIKTNGVFKQIEKLNNKYFAIGRANWKEYNYSETIWCYPIRNNIIDVNNGEFKLSIGIKLALASPNKQEIVLAYFEKEDIDLIKKYVELRGFDAAKVVKADWD